jgi:predicted peptidase
MFAMMTAMVFSLAALSASHADPISEQFAEGVIQHDGRGYPYRLLVPEDPETAQPLVVFLHGAGERGSNNTSQLGHFPKRVVTEPQFKGKPCYVLAMQCPKDDQWASYKTRRPVPGPPRAAMVALIKAIAKTVSDHNVDANRIYLVGLSMGGYGSWDLAARHPDWFAAVVPVCGGGHTATAQSLVDVPIWAFHGTADRVVPERESARMVDAIRNAGGRPAYTPLKGVGHNSWNFAYGPHGAMEWMFAQRNAQTPSITTDNTIGVSKTPEP